ncbi:MAG: hypothetical protein HY774_00710 [Acidobacteria bacterium]|nr:hypothetical protein [Acidobacteriota bacterium]
MVKTTNFFDNQTRLSANPHFYDYLHCLDFEPDGLVRMLDGGGQVINTEAHGRYRISQVDDAFFQIHFSELVETNPYADDRILRHLDDFSVTVEKQDGLFAFHQEVVWHIADKTKWPCLLYPVRYVFNIDPLEFGNSNQEHNLYFILEKKDFRNSTHYYYAAEDAQELPADQLEQLILENKNSVCWPAKNAAS